MALSPDFLNYVLGLEATAEPWADYAHLSSILRKAMDALPERGILGVQIAKIDAQNGLDIEDDLARIRPEGNGEKDGDPAPEALGKSATAGASAGYFAPRALPCETW